MVTSLRLAVLALIWCVSVSYATNGDRKIPEPLKTWEDWALWDLKETREAPPAYNDAAQRLVYWPSALRLLVENGGGSFSMEVAAYAPVRIKLPGSGDAWPVNVKVNGELVPVVPHEKAPSIELPQGSATITGEFRWGQLPSQLNLSKEIGLVELTLNGQRIEFPTWDERGILWLRHEAPQEAAERDFIATKVYALLSDDIPMRWEMIVELTVSGRNREENLGSVLPEGWQLASLNAPIPAMVDEAGRLKAQVRSGRWEVKLSAFRLNSPSELRFAEGSSPIGEEMLVGFQAKPILRVLDLAGASQIDASQTTYPEAWRQYPVYLWKVAQPIVLEERMRGEGEISNAGLKISRNLWLDEKQGGYIFRDSIAGENQTLWRLDSAPGQRLEAAKSNDQGLLITRNPETDATGVEVRDRTLNLTANGVVEKRSGFSATGWQANAEALSITLNLPPGWRLFACFGADSVKDAWLSSWTLLDLFLVLVFTVAVYRLWGVKMAVLAFFAFAISYHEPGAPVYAWLVLLVPLALLRVVREGWGVKLLTALKYAVIAVLAVILVPFVITQVQQAIYPQLEPQILPSDYSSSSGSFSAGGVLAEEAPSVGLSNAPQYRSKIQVRKLKEDSLYELAPAAKVQVGRGMPQWSWRTIEISWRGPVAASQEVRPVLLPRGVVRGITIVRVVLLLLLAAALILPLKRLSAWVAGGRAALLLGATTLLFGIAPAQAQGAFPDATLLDTLRQRLLETPDAFPTAADIPFARLSISGRQLTLEATVHTAVTCAVPLPGRFPAWSPVRVSVDGEANPLVQRRDGFLWVVLSAGVHHVRVEGMIAAHGEWEWTYQLAPRQVEVVAPDWNVTGWSNEAGRPGAQLLFARKERTEGAAASGYDRQEVQSWVSVERRLELGLTWTVTTTVTRRTPPGRSLSLRVPLLSGEQVVTTGVRLDGDAVEVSLGAQATHYQWVSELTPVNSIRLLAPKDVPWVEQWTVQVSPVWNIAMTGIAPIFPAAPQLAPVWFPWPGEEVTLAISRPKTVEGPTLAIGAMNYQEDLGARQRTSKLTLSLESSIGEEFAIGLPEGAEVTSLKLGETSLPVRRDGRKLMLTLPPGTQALEAEWRRDGALGLMSRADEVRLPYESANVSTTINVPGNRWTLWVSGPLVGPAVIFWGILLVAIVGGWALARVPQSPLKTHEWILLLVGLSQLYMLPAFVLIGWFFLLVIRGRESFRSVHPAVHGLVQLVIVGLTIGSLGILIGAVAKGLLSDPLMFIEGNSSSARILRWFEPQSGEVLPQPTVITVSVWWFRLLMLVWALWLANAVIRWLGWGWKQFSDGGVTRPLLPQVIKPNEQK